MQKLVVGLFDSLAEQPWVHLDMANLNSTYSQQVVYEAALQSFVLLKNDRATLPLRPGLHLAVVGPMSNQVGDLRSSCFSLTTDIRSVADAITLANTGGATTQMPGIDVDSTDARNISMALFALVRNVGWKRYIVTFNKQKLKKEYGEKRGRGEEKREC